MADAAFELGLRWAQLQVLCHLAEYRGLSRLHDQHLRGPAGGAGTHEDAIGPFRQAGICRDGSRLLFHQEGFAGKHSLVDKEVFCFQYDTSRGQHHHITRHHLFGWERLRLAATQQAGFDHDLRT